MIGGLFNARVLINTIRHLWNCYYHHYYYYCHEATSLSRVPCQTSVYFWVTEDHSILSCFYHLCWSWSSPVFLLSWPCALLGLNLLPHFVLCCLPWPDSRLIDYWARRLLAGLSGFLLHLPRLQVAIMSFPCTSCNPTCLACNKQGQSSLWSFLSPSEQCFSF